MASDVRRRTTCRLCESADLEEVFSLEPTPIADQYVASEQLHNKQKTYPLDLHFCRRCAHVQLLTVVDPQLIFSQYLYVTSTSLGLVEHFRAYVNDVLSRFSFPSGAWVVEIGSNEGSLLRSFQEKGFRVLGIDPAREIARQATLSGVETLPEFFTVSLARNLRKERGAASIITANNVFAHNDDLAGMAQGVAELLSDDGIFVFEVAYLAEFIRQKRLDTIYHEHLSYHSVRPLASFLKRNRLRLLDVSQISSKGGSLRCYACLERGRWTDESSVQELLAHESDIHLDRIETFRAFALDMQENRTALKIQLRDLKKRKKRIAGFGASPGSTTLIYYFGLQDGLTYLVDENRLKQSRFSPGHHLPVYPAEKLIQDRPDYTLILAFPYADVIMQKQRSYAERGGKFIIPLPELTVI